MGKKILAIFAKNVVYTIYLLILKSHLKKQRSNTNSPYSIGPTTKNESTTIGPLPYKQTSAKANEGVCTYIHTEILLNCHYKILPFLI